MLQHRHAWPERTDGGDPTEISWWHDPKSVHRKYPTAHDGVIETREKGNTGSKRSTPAKDIPRDPEVVRALYQLERMN